MSANKHVSSEMTFAIFKEAWYASAQPDHDPEITISLASAGGGTTGEFSFRWVDLGSHGTAPRLQVFEDAWSALAEVNTRTGGRFLAELAAMDGAAPEPGKVALWLVGLGFRDDTDRSNPNQEVRGSADPRDATIEALAAEVDRLATFAEGAVWGRPEAGAARALLRRLGLKP